MSDTGNLEASQRETDTTCRGAGTPHKLEGPTVPTALGRDIEDGVCAPKGGLRRS